MTQIIQMKLDLKFERQSQSHCTNSLIQENLETHENKRSNSIEYHKILFFFTNSNHSSNLALLIVLWETKQGQEIWFIIKFPLPKISNRGMGTGQKLCSYLQI